MNDDQYKVVVVDNIVGVDIAVASVDAVGIDGCIKNDDVHKVVVVFDDILGVAVAVVHIVGYTDNDDRYMVVADLDNNAVAVVVVGFVVAVDVDNISGYDLLLEVWESLFCKFQKPVPQASAGERVFPLYSFTMWRCDENKGKYKIVNYS